MLNADLAVGYASVIVISCFALALPLGSKGADQEAMNAGLVAEIAGLRQGGAEVEVIAPGPEFLALTHNGAKMLDGSLMPEAWQIGASQAVREANRVGASWRNV